MRVEQRIYTRSRGWLTVCGSEKEDFRLVLVWGSKELLADQNIYTAIREMYPLAEVVLCSTAGEILGERIYDDSVCLTAISFSKTAINTCVVDAGDFGDSYKAGQRLAGEVRGNDLISVFVLSDGQKVNGSELVAGLSDGLPGQTILTGGLAGDGTQFSSTLVGLNATPSSGKIVAIGFYGGDLLVSCGSMGGWDPFGPRRLITRSQGNILFELDNKPALDIYKKYLGDYASELPGAALHFPLSIGNNGSDPMLVRTILSINEADKSMTFAGNVPQGSYAQLMKANFDRLIDGASSAASTSLQQTPKAPDLALLISCVGRKLVLGQRAVEEIEAVRTMYGESTTLAGFYSYGEIAPFNQFIKCELHNQTMTITTLTEI
jgi:hypothetical protein